jgi:hypothetical protein
MQGNPFPGLRPFRQEEEYLFFGRERQVDTLVDRLCATHFLAVVGTSGSGKSSLVNCGLVPALHRGLMAQAGSAWRVACLRPGNRPIAALAEALAAPGVLTMEAAEETGFTRAELVEATLRLSKLGLIDMFEQSHRDASWNLLVVVDQFEELFRYRALAEKTSASASAGDDAIAFVNLLLEAGANCALPVYIVLTMRSDFLGDCAQFFGLPEAINRGQYLVPRMTREERRAAISEPVRVHGAQIDPALLTRLVNDVGDDPDQLSILQHALNRTWARWQEQGAAGPLSMEHYEAVGAMAHALNLHADEAYFALPEGAPRAVCEALFKAITDKTTDARGTRRPTRFDTLCEITGAPAEELAAVIEVFRDPARAFLMPPAGVELRPDTPIDISHESLMRVWDRLRGWCDEEARSAQTYRRVAETADLHASGSAALLRQPELQFARNWQARQRPTAAWAERYRSGLDAALAFVQESQKAFEAEERAEAARQAKETRDLAERRRVRLLLLVAFPVIGVLLMLISAMVYYYRHATVESARANDAATQAEQARAKAEEALAAERRAIGAQQAQAQAYALATSKAPVMLKSRIERAIREKTLVYLQFADPEQRSLAERLRKALEQERYSTPGVEQVGSVPARTELRYFREDADADAVTELAALLRRWNFGTLTPRLIKGYEKQAQLRQFEIWLARPDPEEVRRLVQQLDSTDKATRLAAGQALQDRYTASPLAITEALAALGADRIGKLSETGRLNILFFLSRTAPLAWTPPLEATAREMLAAVHARANAGAKIGEQTRAELHRLDGLLDAVEQGKPAAPASGQ